LPFPVPERKEINIINHNPPLKKGEKKSVFLPPMRPNFHFFLKGKKCKKKVTHAREINLYDRRGKRKMPGFGRGPPENPSPSIVGAP